MRAYELARDLGVDSKELLERCRQLGIVVKTHSSSLTDEQVVQLKTASAPPKSQVPASTDKGKTDQTTAGAKAAPRKLVLRKGLMKRVLKIPRRKPAGEAAKEAPVSEQQATWTGHLTVAPPERKAPAPPKEAGPAPKPAEGAQPKVKVIYRPGEGEEARVAAAGKGKGVSKAVGRIDLEKAEAEEAARKAPRVKSKGRDEWRTNAIRALVEEEEETTARPAAFRRVKVQRGPIIKPRPTEAELVTPVTVKDFSLALGIRASQIIGKLMQIGVMANINQVLNQEMVEMLASQFGVKVTLKTPKDISAEFLEEQKKVEDKAEDLTLRAPVVTFMGHVDHGKTSLLDAIRQANVVATESGGITQHIGAYRVKTPNGKSVVFLDTPGHEAFTSMRARGANVTDVVVLVVAADDGVMPQTEEAINHARAAEVPMVVAVNKVDKPNANVLRVRQQLASMGLQPEDWGGQTVFVETSATTKKGLDELVEMLSLEAELLELKANRNRLAEGTVLEARVSEGRGSTATVLVQNGTLHVGDAVLCGKTYGRVRAIYDDRGEETKEAGPSMPVTVLGLSEMPEAGDRLFAVADLAQAKEVGEARARKTRQAEVVERAPVTLENLFAQIEIGRLKELRIILKADVKGSAEVLRKSIEEVSTAEVKVNILHSAVGGINESDVLLAHASDAIVIGFHVAPDERARKVAEDKGVEIRLYQVIYQVIEDVRKALEGLLEPERKEVVDGHLEVRETFKVSRVGTIAGCYVTDGVIPRNATLRLYRDGVLVYQGKIETLRRFKDDVREVRAGFECGLKIANFDDVKVGDKVEALHVEELARKL